MIYILSQKSKFFILDYVHSQNRSYLINVPPWLHGSIFLYDALYMTNYQKIDKKLKKCWVPWIQNLNWPQQPLFYTQVKSSCVW